VLYKLFHRGRLAVALHHTEFQAIPAEISTTQRALVPSPKMDAPCGYIVDNVGPCVAVVHRVVSVRGSEQSTMTCWRHLPAAVSRLPVSECTNGGSFFILSTNNVGRTRRRRAKAERC